MPTNPVEVKGKDERSKTGGAFKYRHFVIGFIVMFVYMGAEAILYQLMTPYFKEVGQITKYGSSTFICYYFLWINGWTLA